MYPYLDNNLDNNLDHKTPDLYDLYWQIVLLPFRLLWGIVKWIIALIILFIVFALWITGGEGPLMDLLFEWAQALKAFLHG